MLCQAFDYYKLYNGWLKNNMQWLNTYISIINTRLLGFTLAICYRNEPSTTISDATDTTRCLHKLTDDFFSHTSKTLISMSRCTGWSEGMSFSVCVGGGVCVCVGGGGGVHALSLNYMIHWISEFSVCG